MHVKRKISSWPPCLLRIFLSPCFVLKNRSISVQLFDIAKDFSFNFIQNTNSTSLLNFQPHFCIIKKYTYPRVRWRSINCHKKRRLHLISSAHEVPPGFCRVMILTDGLEIWYAEVEKRGGDNSGNTCCQAKGKQGKDWGTFIWKGWKGGSPER